MMRSTLEIRNLDEVLDWVRDAGPFEVCGLVYAHGAVLITNVHADPTRHFAMSPVEQRATLEELGWPLAIWHSHPGGSAQPSAADMATAKTTGLPCVIVTPDGWVGVFESVPGKESGP